mmetsp:Transcript_9149/g.15345  ORF Transcript_9149/g.15345 Transcript_9149/m.15345 type:complete len:155 (-) Transcript_9149:109-573(-)
MIEKQVESHTPRPQRGMVDQVTTTTFPLGAQHIAIEVTIAEEVHHHEMEHRTRRKMHGRLKVSALLAVGGVAVVDDEHPREEETDPLKQPMQKVQDLTQLHNNNNNNKAALTPPSINRAVSQVRKESRLLPIGMIHLIDERQAKHWMTRSACEK